MIMEALYKDEILNSLDGRKQKLKMQFVIHRILLGMEVYYHITTFKYNRG